MGGVELMEGAVGLLGDDPGHGGLAHTGGAVKDHVGDVAGLDDPAQELPLPQNLLLAYHIVQGAGADFVGKRLVHVFPSLSV